MSDIRVHILPVSPTTCTVLGQRAKSEADPLWAGLDLSRAEMRDYSPIAGRAGPRDPNLGVPWCHPEDQTGSPDDFDCIYRVRPKMEAGKRWKRRLVEHVDIQRVNGSWLIAVVTTPTPSLTSGARHGEDGGSGNG